MKHIENQTFAQERALYASRGICLTNCNFMGELDGESPLKESFKVVINNCVFALRYPLWHTRDIVVQKTQFNETSRAPIWYANYVQLIESIFYCPKALRESKNIQAVNIKLNGNEGLWNCECVQLDTSKFNSEYFGLKSNKVYAVSCQFSGKYTFQYSENSNFKFCEFNTKDAFWHSKNVTLKNCVIKGEYLGWYSENLTLVDCLIIGRQPLCYCKKLKLINCKMRQCENAFELSDVEATIDGEVTSVRYPLSGLIVADDYGEVTFENAPCRCKCDVVKR